MKARVKKITSHTTFYKEYIIDGDENYEKLKNFLNNKHYLEHENDSIYDIDSIYEINKNGITIRSLSEKIHQLKIKEPNRTIQYGMLFIPIELFNEYLNV